MIRLWLQRHTAYRVIRRQAYRRPLWKRVAMTKEGNAILREARHLSCQPQYASLSDAELIRLAYWGASGEKV